jgi:hypothetical protein
MDVADLLSDAVSRVSEQVPTVVGGLGEDDLAWRPDDGANSIAWLVWHLTRMADEYIADYAGTPTRWLAGGWYDRMALPLPPESHGYGHTPAEVAQVRVSGENLAGYYADVEPLLRGYLVTLAPEDLDRVVDAEWDPPVTLGVRMISIVDDMVQHIGQAAYVRGMLGRR